MLQDFLGLCALTLVNAAFTYVKAAEAINGLKIYLLILQVYSNNRFKTDSLKLRFRTLNMPGIENGTY